MQILLELTQVVSHIRMFGRVIIRTHNTTMNTQIAAVQSCRDSTIGMSESGAIESRQ